MRKDLAGVFSGMKEAKPSFDSNWEREGHYWSVINRVKLDQSRKKDTFVCFEKTVLLCLAPDDVARPHKPGEEISHALWAKHESFLGNMKSALGSIMDIPAADVGEEEALMVCDDDQPLQGTVVENYNRIIKTKEKGNDFTRVEYRREVPASEVWAAVEEGLIPRHIADAAFPDGLLEALAAAEAEQGEG